LRRANHFVNPFEMERTGVSNLSDRRLVGDRHRPPLFHSARMRTFSLDQLAFFGLILTGGAAMFWLAPGLAGPFLLYGFALLFLAMAAWRILLVVLSRRPPPSAPDAVVWPRYTVIAALHDEVDVVGQLVENLSQIDYPPDRLQGLLVLEAHDHATIAAALVAPRPDWLEVFIAPPGAPQTKPRALNCALERATGDLLTVYDAEDDPDPLQLKEAAARFARDETGRLACLQAPLRIRRKHRGPTSSPFLDRQFAAEYAALFEVLLPGMARLGLPFPLGGTSNHFRVDVLRRIGGWDAFNVTEDADLGYRLWRQGWRQGVITRPTWETPPGDLDAWLPQRTRWLKGYMQTFGVHTRRAWRLGPAGLFSLFVSLGSGLVSAAIHGPSLAWFAASVSVAAMAGLPPQMPLLAPVVCIIGVVSAWIACSVGAHRAGIEYRSTDMLAAPAYWSLLSLAFVHAAWRLVREPFNWNKTTHHADTPPKLATIIDLKHEVLDVEAAVRLSAPHVVPFESRS
jgi:cellulose synthase/poly-beta-1,6-N-acetylglucosamine synthase-like glycosyltransferase